MLRLEDSLQFFIHAKNREDVLSVLIHFAREHGGQQLSYVDMSTSELQLNGRNLEAWSQRYTEMSYLADDPILAQSLVSTAPVSWQAHKRPSHFRQRQHQIFKEIADFGLTGGLCLTSRAPEQTSVFGFFHDLPPADAPSATDIACITLACQHAHERLRQLCNAGPADVQLTPRERLCLELIKDGLTMGDIAERLRISDRTVVFHLNNCRQKLRASTLAQAVARALVSGLILP